MPFENASGEPAQEALADGLTEDIVAQLSKISGLSVYRFKGIEASPQDKASELGVATLLEGKIRRVGEKIRVSTQLFEVGSNRVLWSENYDRELTDVFALLQTSVDDNMRGRVMGIALAAMQFYGTGFLLGGFLAETVGAELTLHITTAVWFLSGLLAFLRSPEMRNMN